MIAQDKVEIVDRIKAASAVGKTVVWELSADRNTTIVQLSSVMKETVGVMSLEM